MRLYAARPYSRHGSGGRVCIWQRYPFVHFLVSSIISLSINMVQSFCNGSPTASGVISFAEVYIIGRPFIRYMHCFI